MGLLARLAVAWAINAAALWVANALWDGVSIHGWAAYLIGSAVLGIANAILKPILALLTLPLILLTLGLFESAGAAVPEGSRALSAEHERRPLNLLGGIGLVLRDR